MKEKTKHNIGLLLKQILDQRREALLGYIDLLPDEWQINNKEQLLKNIVAYKQAKDDYDDFLADVQKDEVRL